MKYLIRLLTILLVILFPLGLLLRIKLSTNVFVNPSDIVVLFLTFLIWFIDYKEKKIFKDRFYFFQFLFLISGVVSLIINTLFHPEINIFISILYALRYACYLSLTKVGVYFGKSKKILPILYTSALSFVIFGYIQFFLYNDMRKLFYLGWDEHLYRLFSTLFDPNFAGMSLVIIFFLFLPKAVSKSFKRGYPFIIINFFTIVAIFITYSRTALIALFVGLVVLGILNHKIKHLLILILASMILLLTVSDTSIEGLNPFRTVSTRERVRSITEVTKIISSQPLEGAGFNAFRYAQVRYGFRTSVGVALSNSDAGTDNSFLFVEATTGIAGFLFYSLSYFFLIKTLMEEHKKSNMYIVSMIFSALAGSMFLNVLFYTPFLILFFLLIALREKLN